MKTRVKSVLFSRDFKNINSIVLYVEYLPGLLTKLNHNFKKKKIVLISLKTSASKDVFISARDFERLW